MTNHTLTPPNKATAAMTSSPSDVGTSTVLRLGLALGLVVAAQFVLQLDFSIVNVALPTIQRDLHVAPADLQWIVTGYALTFGSLLLFGGRVGDLAGHRRVLLIGLGAFGVASLVAGLAPTSLALIVSRFAQGASAAFVAPQALAIITDLFAEGAPRTRALGIFQGATAAGASAGIVLGGLFTEFVGWRAVFLVNPPIIIALVIAIARVLPTQTRRVGARLDIAGAVLATASIALLIFGLSQGQQRGFTSAPALATVAVAVLLGVSFVIVEKRSKAPMVPLAVGAAPARRALSARRPSFRPASDWSGFPARHCDGDADLHPAHASGVAAFRRADDAADGIDHHRARAGVAVHD
jgi:MFS family permease